MVPINVNRDVLSTKLNIPGPHEKIESLDEYFNKIVKAEYASELKLIFVHNLVTYSVSQHLSRLHLSLQGTRRQGPIQIR